MEGKTQEPAAAAAGMSVRSARKRERGLSPSQRGKPHTWRMRGDPFAEVFDGEVVALLAADRNGVLDAANRYLQQHFIDDFNRRFTLKPAQPESAFVKLAGIELELVLSSKHERIVRNDNADTFKNLILQLPATRQRIHFVRCPVTVPIRQRNSRHQLSGRLLAIYDAAGGPLHPSPNKERAANAQRLASKAGRRVATHRRTPTQNSHFSTRTSAAVNSAGGKMSVAQATNQSQEDSSRV